MENTGFIGISEIFYSIQGEGFHSGTPAIFIRTASCNLTCPFCDTDFTLKKKMRPHEIITEIKSYRAKFIVITGGEPTLQSKLLKPLITNLQSQGYFISIETNGTSLDTLGADWITVSPKIKEGGDWILKNGHELKLVYQSQNLSEYENSNFLHYYLQPIELRTELWGKGERRVLETKNEWEKTILAVKENPKWKLSIQIHKELGLP